MADPTGVTQGTLYVPGFRANLNLAPQQTTSRLLACVDNELAYETPGQFFNADDVGTTDPDDATARVANSPEGFVDVTRRFGAFAGFRDGKFLDSQDKARQLEDPTDPTMAAMMAGQGRKRDQAIIAAAFAAPYLQGNNQAYTLGSANANVIAVNDGTAHQNETLVAKGGGYGLTLGKLIETKLALDNSELDEMLPGDTANNYYLACTSEQLQDLLLTIPATSSYYNQVQALVEGTLSTFVGFNFIRMPRTGISAIPKAAGSYIRKCIAFHKRAIVYRARPIVDTHVAPRADKEFNWYAFYKAEHGAVRRYDAGVWEVDCGETLIGT